MSRPVQGKEQRIIVSSDADYLTAPLLTTESDFKIYNFAYNFWCFSYFSYGQYPANTLRPESIDNAFNVTVDAIPRQKVILYWVIPILIGILGSVVLIRRRRK
jgi:ABC-2 type transport system permease protein